LRWGGRTSDVFRLHHRQTTLNLYFSPRHSTLKTHLLFARPTATIFHQKYPTSAIGCGFIVEKFSSICLGHHSTPLFLRLLRHDCPPSKFIIMVDLLLPTIQNGKAKQPIVQGSPLVPPTSHAPPDWLHATSRRFPILTLICHVNLQVHMLHFIVERLQSPTHTMMSLICSVCLLKVRLWSIFLINRLIL